MHVIIFSVQCIYFRYSVDIPGVDMTVWSTRSVKRMLSNIRAASQELTDFELQTINKLKSDVFSSVQDCHWEDDLRKHRNYWSL